MSDSECGQEVPDLPTPPASPIKSSPTEDIMVEILRNENHFDLNNHCDVEKDNTIGDYIVNGKDHLGDCIVDPTETTEGLILNQVQNLQIETSLPDVEQKLLNEFLDEHLQRTIASAEINFSESLDISNKQLEENNVNSEQIEDFEKSVPKTLVKDDHLHESNQIDSLVEIPVEDWTRLRDMFAEFWPRDILAYNAIDNHLKIKTKNPSAPSRILCLNGDWSDGTFILQDSIAVCVYTLEDNCSRLERALKIFDWSIGPQIHPYDEKHKVVVDKVRDDLGLSMIYNYETIFYWLPKETAMGFDLTAPDDVYVAPLSPEHADIANPVWSRKFDGSDLYMKDAIKNNPSRGVFGKETGDLRSWIMSHNNGVLLALHTHPDHRRKGYGSLILKAISRAKADECSDTVASVLPSNIASVTLFNKLGFKPLEPKWWTKTKPF